MMLDCIIAIASGYYRLAINGLIHQSKPQTSMLQDLDLCSQIALGRSSIFCI